MKYRIEALIPIIMLGYIAFFPTTSGELMSYFIKGNIILPFILVFVALNILTFGVTQLFELLKSLKSFFIVDPLETKLHGNTLTGAISYSYVASTLWVLYILVISEKYNASLESVIPYVALSLMYAFILSELILRPLKKRLEFVK